MQVYNIDGVDISAAGAVGAQNITGGAVDVAEPALMLGEIFVLAIRAFGRTNCGAILQEICSTIVCAARIA